ncbi:MAG: ThiF family adenylyltransferase [Actinomycetota bacterium]|nr:ThiF family adenylyltransferase [Actinomycetota bacterium]
MSALKFVHPGHWSDLEAHLMSGRGEHFAFAHGRVLAAPASGPVIEVMDIELILDEDVQSDSTGWSISDAALDRVHNAAATGGYALIEFHNHHRGPASFSRTDELGLEPMANYVTDLLPGRPYGAGVYAEGHVHVDYWTRTDTGVERETFRSVAVLDDHLRILNAGPPGSAERHARQADVLGDHGNATLEKLRVAVVGAGGTGSHAAVALAYLGVTDVLVLDDDLVEITNLNRLVTATTADIGAPKNLVARRRMRDVDPAIHVVALPGLSPDTAHPELHDVDLIIGCVDHDGPRDRLNQIAIDTATPYIDIATGIDATTTPPTLGGRVVIVTPAGPCLHCVRELDPVEVSRWNKDEQQQALDREHGYGAPGGAPSVVHLNGITVHVAVAELIAWISGHRAPAQYLDIDLSGLLAATTSPSGTRVVPRVPAKPVPACIACSHRKFPDGKVP